MTYGPAPIDTSQVVLDHDLIKLSHLLARNNHEVWARQRLSDGWRYGPARDDNRKEHPSLVPYEELSESEKEYDLVLATELLKAIKSLGFQVVKP